MVLVLLVPPLLAMLSSGSRQSLGWTCVNVCSDRSNGDTGQVRVHGIGMVHALHAPSVIAPAPALRRRAAVAVAVRSSLPAMAHGPRAACSLAQRPNAMRVQLARSVRSFVWQGLFA